MSFSQDIKTELCSVITDRDKEFAFLYGMVLFCRRFGAEEIIFRTESALAAEMFVRLSDKLLGENSAELTNKQRENGTMYTVSVSRQEDREEMIYRFRISSRSLIHRINMENINNNNVFAFLAGAFLSCGSMTDPYKEYHLEFAVPFEELCRDLKELIEGFGMEPKYTPRKGLHVIYFKGSEAIEDMLTLMGAGKSTLELMNVKIYKDICNKANRIANCDNANIERTLKASGRQIEDIEYIMKTKGFDSLSPELRNIAEVRLENPDASLKELCELLDKPIGRSGANHRLKKLSEIAEELRRTGQ